MRPEFILIFATLVLRCGELWTHRLNRRFLLKHGAKETAPRLVWSFLGIEWLSIVLMISEWLIFLRPVDPLQRHIAVVIIFAAFLVRLWVRSSLGRMWNLGLLYVPGVERIEKGPYRYFAHPDYLARFFEFLGLGLFFGAYFSFGIYLGLSLILMPRLMVLEKRQLRLLSN